MPTVPSPASLFTVLVTHPQLSAIASAWDVHGSTSSSRFSSVDVPRCQVASSDCHQTQVAVCPATDRALLTWTVDGPIGLPESSNVDKATLTSPALT